MKKYMFYYNAKSTDGTLYNGNIFISLFGLSMETIQQTVNTLVKDFTKKGLDLLPESVSFSFIIQLDE